MRTEQEMMELIFKFANRYDDIRAVVMNGSRVNPNARRDPFQDYDIACYVREVATFRRNPDIPGFFGELMILQTPEDMGDPPPVDEGWYSYLMQFMDGNRIDLSFHPLDRLRDICDDSLSVVLMDKDDQIAKLPPPDDRSYLAQKPDAKAFDDCCNEFWWLNSYVAKGLWRDELTYAKHMLDTYLREELMKMLTWYFGMRTDFKKSPGKFGKYLQAGLEDELWKALEATYSDSNPDHNWQALFAMDELFGLVAREIASRFGFTYPDQESRRVTDFIHQIKDLPGMQQ